LRRYDGSRDRFDNGGSILGGTDNLVSEILMSFVLWVFIVTGVVGIALGIGLNVNSGRTLQFLKTMNRWVSMRGRLKALEVPHDIDDAIYRHRRWSGTLFLVSGIYTVVMLLFVVEFPYVVAVLSRSIDPAVVGVVVESLRWFLFLGGLLAIVVGVMMLASNHTALQALQTRLNRWYSSRQAVKGADRMNTRLDDLAEAYPRTAGVLLAFGSAIVFVAAMIVWLGNWKF
jgi:hypothetical protein